MRRPRTLALVAVLGAGALTLSACGGSSFDGGASSSSGDSSASSSGAGAGGALTVLIGSSGDAETKAVTDAVAAWSKDSGVEAKVQVASDLTQELSQGFAAKKPADVFYASADAFQGWAANGSLLPYGDKLSNVDDFYPTLKDTFTYDGKLYCAPKDFSTLGLVINTDAWTAAGLTDADVPTTWEQLADVATKLTTPEHVGLGFGGEYARIGAFLAEAGGTMTSKDGAKATVDSAENLKALQYVKDNLTAGSFAYAADLGTGWGGEAFGTGKAAMTIEGNWITGALKNDFPDVKYKVVELPAGPAGKGTMQFTNCWGIAADSANQDAAVTLVEHLTTTDQQLAFAKAFGVMPSVQSAADGYKGLFPELTAFVDGAAYAQGVVNAQGAGDVITDFNSQLTGLKTGDPKAILSSVQGELQSVLDKANG
jgi:multiple sugar transport system substrate-binding protein